MPILLHTAGPEAQEIHRTLTYAEEEDNKDYNTVLSKLRVVSSLNYTFRFLLMFFYGKKHVSVGRVYFWHKIISFNRQSRFHLTTTMRTYLDFKVVSHLFVMSTSNDKWR